MANPYPSWQEISRSDAYEGKHYPKLADDTPTFLGVPHAVTKDDLKGADVVIIGAPYVAGWGSDFAGVGKAEWLASPKRVRQQSGRYFSYILDFDMDVFEAMKVVDYGDAAIPPRAN